jgi:predicted phosphoribosyltransferase
MILFEDRLDAAEQLAKRIEESLDKNVVKTRQELQQRKQQKSNDYDVIILAIPRGGVVIGDVLSSILGAKLDIIVSKKMGAPSNPELAIGAIMPDGSYFLNEDIVGMLKVPPSYVTEQVNIYSVGQFYKKFEQVSDAEVKEIMRRHGHVDYV